MVSFSGRTSRGLLSLRRGEFVLACLAGEPGDLLLSMVEQRQAINDPERWTARIRRGPVLDGPVAAYGMRRSHEIWSINERVTERSTKIRRQAEATFGFESI
jgi:hypothetical protein